MTEETKEVVEPIELSKEELTERRKEITDYYKENIKHLKTQLEGADKRGHVARRARRSPVPAAGRVRCDPARRTNYKRYSQASFVECGFFAAEVAVGIEEVVRASIAAVVGAEEYVCVVV